MAEIVISGLKKEKRTVNTLLFKFSVLYLCWVFSPAVHVNSGWSSWQLNLLSVSLRSPNSKRMNTTAQTCRGQICLPACLPVSVQISKQSCCRISTRFFSRRDECVFLGYWEHFKSKSLMMGAWGKWVSTRLCGWTFTRIRVSEQEGKKASDGFQLAWEMFIVQEENYFRSMLEHWCEF